MARFMRLQGQRTFFLTGTDEHSINVEKRARVENMDPQSFCDMMSERWRRTWNEIGISNDDFIRTSEQRHIKAVLEFLKRVDASGDIYKGIYKGWYCEGCEEFKQEKDLIDGRCPLHPSREPVWLEEENYFFRLSRYQQPLLEYIDKHPDFIQPETRKNEVVSLIRSGLEDFSISRSGARWGIPLPWDESQVVYVWFDALVNYLSAVGFGTDISMFESWWPATYHLIGKDILRFHAVYWPAMLMSAKLPLPEHVFAHGFLYFKGMKMSKTEGNIISPQELINVFGIDGMRYALLRQVPFGQDGDISWQQLVERYNSDLANDLGNLVQRVLGMVMRYCDGVVPRPIMSVAPDDDLKEVVTQSVRNYKQHMMELRFSEALSELWLGIGRANRYVAETKPWELVSENRLRLETVIYNLLDIVRLIGYVLYPIMPGAANKILSCFNAEGAEWIKAWTVGALPPGIRLVPVSPIFPRIEDAGS